MRRIRLNWFVVTFGLGLSVFSVYLAVVFKFKSFYELLLLGIVFFLLGFKATTRIKFNSYLKIYVTFLFLGIVGDLVLGVSLLQLWYYNYDNPIQYLLLYGWVYPAGGLTLTLLFIVLLDLLNLKTNISEKYTFNLNDELVVGFVGIGIILVTLLYGVLDSANYIGLIVFGLTSLVIFLVLNIYVEKTRGFSFFYLLRVNKLKVSTAALISVLVMVFLHEVPNTIANQWVYTNIPLWPALFEVPLVVWVGWSVLFIVPMTSLLVFISKEEFYNLIKD